MDKYLLLADEYGNNLEDMEDFARFRGLVRGTNVSGTPVKQGYSGVPGDLPANSFVGNIGISARRTLLNGNRIDRNLPIFVGLAFAFSDYYNFLAQKNYNLQMNVIPVYQQNTLYYVYTDGVNAEQIEVLGGSNYNIFSFMQGLYNVRALCNKVRISLPFEDNSRLNSWQREGMAIFKQSWLSNTEKQPVTVSRAPGQFNRSVYDSNIPVLLSNVEGIGVYIPPLPPGASVNDNETTDITLYFSNLQRI